ncbi:hypothetical protein TNCV_5006211 [Trichonephila clavipes]|uniref:Uncharacterized protein n=1 Tax=Trichonephila clavipes TaxID=2585209 RepID=A0A8X6VI70_TRICX|nr:hypothetical protein TNCV_5006211 [Trichonephila clavipes]
MQSERSTTELHPASAGVISFPSPSRVLSISSKEAGFRPLSTFPIHPSILRAPDISLRNANKEQTGIGKNEAMGLGGAGDRTQGLSHAKRTLYH